MKKPKLESMTELHELIAVQLTAMLKSEDAAVRLRAAELAIKFLHNNGVNVDLNETTAGKRLTGSLPFTPKEEVA